MKNKIALIITGSVVLTALALAAPAFAQTPSTQGAPQGGWGRGNMFMNRMPGIFGTVSAINGEVLSVESRSFGKNATTTTYSVDASNATVFKNGATSTLASIAVSDKIMAQGTVSGTSVAATIIRDGMPAGMHMGMPWGGHASSSAPMRHATSTLPQGNGEPVVGGKVTAISGSTLTITNASNVTYTVDATNATVNAKGQSSSLANVAVGDNLVVQGTVNGNAVVASSIIDQGAPVSAGTSVKAGIGGFFGGLGNFFHRLFGFF